MAEKFGARFFEEMIGRGGRELGGFFYQDSNIAQPQYSLRGPVKESQVPTVEAREDSVLEEHVAEAGRGGYEGPDLDEHEHDRY